MAEHYLSFIKKFSFIDILVFFLYVILLFLAKWIILFILRRSFASKMAKKRVIPIIEALLNWISFYGTILIFLFYFSKEKWLFSPIYERDGVEVSLFLIIVAIMIITLASRIVKAFNSHIMPFFYERLDVDMGMGYTINRLIYYSVMILAIIISFATVGLDLKSLAVVLSALGVGIGFGLRNIAANFVSGIIILFERPLEVGEMVEIEDNVGTISKIKLRSTVVSYEGGTLVVPNQYFIEHIVKNRSGATVMAQVRVSVVYGSDPKKIEALLTEAANNELSNIAAKATPTVRLIDFHNSALVFLVEAPVTTLAEEDQMESRLRHSIITLFYENKVNLASFKFENVKDQE